ncbi:MAG: hypothetical protein WCP96_16900 [Methylococcaceae bacterium]
MIMQKKWNRLAALLIGCALLPVAYAKEAHALVLKHSKNSRTEHPD